jgi:hypothetical protein
MFSLQSISIYYLALIALIEGLSLFYINIYIKNFFFKNTHHLLSFSLLPVITLIITVTIAGNVALALGMVGALSIVRFRNPVRSPYELTIYFLLITLGISLGANLYYNIILFLFSSLTLLLLNYLQSLGILNLTSNNNFFEDFNFNNNALISITSERAIIEIDEKKIVNYSIENNLYNYCIEVKESEKYNILKKYKSLKEIKSVKIL